MKKILFILFINCIHQKIDAQELFVFTEPASNMAAKSVGVRLMNSFMNETKGGINYHLMPEIMLGVNSKVMLHAQGFISNRNNSLVGEGASLYAKYKFINIDNVHSHFRMASYGRYSFNNSDIHQDEIETMGHNSGYELGLVATQLINKLAISSSVSFERAIDNTTNNKFPNTQSNKAINYTLSFGKLILPKEYVSYKQVNMNFMLEFLGQSLQGNGKSFLDIAPSVQFIVNSQARFDLGYRQQLYSNMLRTAPSGFVLKFEYTFFNVYK